jgi:hypothetical protein
MCGEVAACADLRCAAAAAVRSLEPPAGIEAVLRRPSAQVSYEHIGNPGV